MTQERIQQIKDRIRAGESGNVEHIIAEILLAILEELKKKNKSIFK